MEVTSVDSKTLRVKTDSGYRTREGFLGLRRLLVTGTGRVRCGNRQGPTDVGPLWSEPLPSWDRLSSQDLSFRRRGSGSLTGVERGGPVEEVLECWKYLFTRHVCLGHGERRRKATVVHVKTKLGSPQFLRSDF